MRHAFAWRIFDVIEYPSVAINFNVTVQPIISSIHKPASYAVSRCYAAFVYFISEMKGILP